MNLPIAPTTDGTIVTIKLTPRARQAGIEGVATEPGPDGDRPVLKVKVTAPPEDGKANAALIALLAKAWRLPKGAFAIVSGETQRLKRVHVRAAAETVAEAITGASRKA